MKCYGGHLFLVFRGFRYSLLIDCTICTYDQAYMYVYYMDVNQIISQLNPTS